MRTNVYKEKVLEALKKSHLLSISDIHKNVSDADYSTVYRNVKQLVAEKQVRKVVLDKGSVMYELSNYEQGHDHFLCLDCGEVEEIQLSRKSVPISKKHTIHDLLIRGVCDHCNT
jgi:Fe2+ or Zn2+ uptake regulation protein